MNAIVAVYSDWGIGCSGTQPIVLPEDRAYFKETTNGGAVITGRRTFLDFGHPLPNRKNIILTSNRNFAVPGAFIVHDLDGLWHELAHDDPEKTFVIGGESIYRQLLPYCTRAYVTKIDLAPQSDSFFANLDSLSNWKLDECGDTCTSGDVRYSISTYKNNSPEDYYV